jgi:hypothetical protein
MTMFKCVNNRPLFCQVMQGIDLDRVKQFAHEFKERLPSIHITYLVYTVAIVKALFISGILRFRTCLQVSLYLKFLFCLEKYTVRYRTYLFRRVVQSDPQLEN